MTQKAIKFFINEIYSKGPKKTYPSIKTDVYRSDDIWRLAILDLKDYGLENNRGYRFVLVIVDSLWKFVWCIPLKNKKVQTIKDSFENLIINPKRRPNLLESDRGKEFF